MAPNHRQAVAECVSDDALVHLKTYKYSSVDKSPVSKYILGPYWNWAVGLMPMWVAPNMVTLIGFFFILGNIGLLLIFMPDLVGPGPSWLYFSFAFGLFMYQTMDNIDGKQARRTGTSSGLGELFDHGIDSLNCCLASLLETAAMGLGTSPAGVVTCLTPCLPMFFSTWETYHTHTLYLGVINGPTEGLLIACFLMILSGIYGPGIFNQPITDLIGEHGLFGLGDLIGRHTLRDYWIFVMVGSLLIGHIPFCIINVVQARLATDVPSMPVFAEWLPMGVFSISIVAWLYAPASRLLADNHLVLFAFTVAFIFGRLTTKMILAHLTRQPFPLWTGMLWPLVGGAALMNAPMFGFPALSPLLELYYLYGSLVFATIVYFRWAFLVVGSICNYLGISALTIPAEKQAENWRRMQAEAQFSTTLSGTHGVDIALDSRVGKKSS